jgi:hypothetical protein
MIGDLFSLVMIKAVQGMSTTFSGELVPLRGRVLVDKKPVLRRHVQIAQINNHNRFRNKYLRSGAVRPDRIKAFRLGSWLGAGANGKEACFFLDLPVLTAHGKSMCYLLVDQLGQSRHDAKHPSGGVLHDPDLPPRSSLT